MDRWDRMFPWTCSAARAVGRAVVLRRLLVVAAVVLVAVPAAVHVRAWVFRWEARRFLSDVRALEMGKTPGSEALKLREKYGPSPYHRTDPCTAERCELGIAVSAWTSYWSVESKLFLRSSPWYGAWQKLLLVFGPVGLRPAMAIATIRIRHGVVVGVSPTVYFQDWSRWLHGAAAEAEPNLQDELRFARWQGPPDPYLENWLLKNSRARNRHPDLYVRRWDGSGSAGVTVEFTPQVSREEFLRLTHFDVSCATRLPVCSDGDLAPEIERLVEEDLSHGKQESGDWPCTAQAMRWLGRDVGVVAHLRVKRIVAQEPNVAYVDYQLVEKLKSRRMHWWSAPSEDVAVPTARVAHYLHTHGPMIDAQTGKLSRMFEPGNEVIAFFAQLDGIREIPCGVVPATAENLVAVRAGISEDRTDEWR